jgi:NTP pyrophosphatase (non-canonical NTP hydrolase)
MEQHSGPCGGNTDSILELTRRIQDFVSRRDWHQFHSPKDMAVAITAEAGELLQHFVWKTPEQSHVIAESRREAIADEIADVAILLLELSDNLGLQLGDVVTRKLERNEIRYPADKVRGTNLKYNELDDGATPSGR